MGIITGVPLMGAIFLQGLGTGLPGSKGQDMLTKSPPAALSGALDDVGLMAHDVHALRACPYPVGREEQF